MTKIWKLYLILIRIRKNWRSDMQKQEIENLKIELKKYEGKTTGIEIQGSINLFFNIDNMKTFVSKQTIILSDCKENELRIENHYINDVIIEKNKIILQFERRL